MLCCRERCRKRRAMPTERVICPENKGFCASGSDAQAAEFAGRGRSCPLFSALRERRIRAKKPKIPAQKFWSGPCYGVRFNADFCFAPFPSTRAIAASNTAGTSTAKTNAHGYQQCGDGSPFARDAGRDQQPRRHGRRPPYYQYTMPPAMTVRAAQKRRHPATSAPQSRRTKSNDSDNRTARSAPRRLPPQQARSTRQMPSGRCTTAMRAAASYGR